MVLAVLGIAPAHAVHVSPSGSGQALIVPLYTVESGFDTLVSVTNTLETDQSAAALKVHFVSPDGELERSFNLYLRRLSTWAFALSERDGQAASSPFEAGCLLQDDQGEVAPVAQFELAATHGYIELIEMGRLTDPVLLGALRDGDCDALATAWPGPALDPPAGGLRASVSLINVPRSTMYSFNATALDNFRTAAMHTAPSDPLPDLSAADNHPDHTTSRNCNISPCVEDEWDVPVDAVSAALMAREVKGEFVISPGIGARTEWVVNFPMQRFYPPEHLINDGQSSFLNSSRTGETYTANAPVCFPLPSPFCEAQTQFVQTQRAVEILEFLETQVAGDHESSILGAKSPVRVFPRKTGGVPATAGFARLGFALEGDPSLESNSGQIYSGRPNIGIILQQFTRGEIGDDGALMVSEYGNSFPLSQNLERLDD